MFGAIAGAAVGVLGGALMDDNGAEGAADASAGLSRQSAAAAKEYQDDWRTYYRPIEREQVIQTLKYAKPEYRDRLAGEYKAAVNNAYSDADKAGFESLRARGVDPTSGNAASFMGSMGLERAAAVAGADRQATRDAEDNFFSKSMAMTQQGRGLVGAAQNATGAAQNGFQMNLANANQMNANQAYAVAPFVNAVSTGVQKYVDKNAGKWFGGGSGQTPNMKAISNMGGFNEGGEVEAKGLARRKPRRRLAEGGVSEPGTTHSGIVVGPGDGTVDTVPAILANGEQVINAEAVKIVGRPFLDAINKVGLMRRYDREQREAA